MKIQEKSRGDIVVVQPLEARIDASVSSEFREHLERLMAQGVQKIVLNFSEVAFIDSSGLGVIVACIKKLRASGQFVLCSVCEEVYALLRLTRMDKIFHLAADETDALSYLAAAKEQPELRLRPAS